MTPTPTRAAVNHQLAFYGVADRVHVADLGGGRLAVYPVCEGEQMATSLYRLLRTAFRGCPNVVVTPLRCLEGGRHAA
jgi:hypothetical protein